MKKNGRQNKMEETQTSRTLSQRDNSSHLKITMSAREQLENVSIVSDSQAAAALFNEQLSSGCENDFLNGSLDSSSGGKELSMKSIPQKSSRNYYNSSIDAMKSTLESHNQNHSSSSSSDDDLADVLTVKFNSNKQTVHCLRNYSEEDDEIDISEAGNSSVKSKFTIIEGYRVYTNPCEEEFEIKQEQEEYQEDGTSQNDSSEHFENSTKTMDVSSSSSEVAPTLPISLKPNLATTESQMLFSAPPSKFFCDYAIENSDNNIVPLPVLKRNLGSKQTKFKAPFVEFGSPVITGSFLNTSHETNTDVKTKHSFYTGTKLPEASNDSDVCQSKDPEETHETAMFTMTPDMFKRLSKEIPEPQEGTSGQPFKKKKKLKAFSLETEVMYNYVIEEISESEFKCRNCKEIFQEKDKAVAHLDVHHPFKCGVCLETFKSFGLLSDHKRTVHQEVQFCNRCLYKTPYLNHLDKHIREKHKDTRVRRASKEICYVCGEISGSRESMDSHLKHQHGIENVFREGDFKCPVCNYLTIAFNGLKFHMWRHAGVFQYCPVEDCDFKHASKQRVQAHYEKVHLGVRTCPCPFEGCSFVGKRPASLKIHLNVVHYKVRNFICPHCPKAFMARSHLDVHMRLHNDVKPIKCEHCDYRCCQRASLNWHMKKHHPEHVKDSMKKGIHNYKVGRKGKQKKPSDQTDTDFQ